MDRFGCDQHEVLIRKLLHIKQSGSITEYIDQFAQLVDQLSAYENRADPLYYAVCFVDGLRHDVRTTVLGQRPPDLDTAFALAQLQDVITEPWRKTQAKPEFHSSARQPTRYPLPPPPQTSDKQQSQVGSVDKKSGESSHAQSAEEKWAALRAYRRARGLCDRCAEKHVCGHRCSPTVQLHVLQQVLEIF